MMTDFETLPIGTAKRIEELENENKRLNQLAKDAVLSLTDEIGAGDDPVAFVCAAYVYSRHENERLRDEVNDHTRNFKLMHRDRDRLRDALVFLEGETRGSDELSFKALVNETAREALQEQSDGD